MAAEVSTITSEIKIREDVSNYTSVRHRYDELCEETKRIVISSFKSRSIPYHIIEGRAKTVDSFEKKAKRKDSNDNYKYSNPIGQITDLSGVRIITYTLKDVLAVCEFISSNFDVLERRDVGEERFRDGKFGYQSIHFLVKYPDERVNLPDFIRFRDMVCEIQVRTVLQHAWAEIEHDIQYKNQSGLPTLIQRKFIALAGLLEIADREFQAIQDEDQQLKSNISEALQEELTKGAIAGKAIATKSDDTGAELPEESSVRALVRAAKYDEAILLYNQKIESSPMMHTLYLGRARVKFLSGDRAGALQDIDKALDLNPEDSVGLRLREQVKEGTSEHVRPSGTDSNELTKKGNQLLEQGDGVAAFEYYSLAQQEGASRPFSLINKSMSCFMASDFQGAKYLLSGLDIRMGTTMAATIVAMYCMVYASDEPSRFDEEVKKLEDVLSRCDNFSFKLSPLARLHKAISSSNVSMDENVKDRIDRVFEILGAEE